MRRYAGRWSLACPAIRPHFFGACPKKRCRAAKERRFDASTSPWWAHPPLPFGRKPQRDELVRQVGLCPVGKLARQSQLDAVGCDVGASSPWERRAGPNSYRGGTLKRVSLGLHPVSLRKSKEMGWNGQQGGETSDQENGAPAPARGWGLTLRRGAFWRVFCLLPRTCNYCIIESCELAKILCI